MYVCGSHGMSVERLQQLVARAVCGQRVRRWSQAVESVLSIVVRFELSSQIVGALVVWILEVVLSVAARLPDVEGHVGERLLCGKIADDAMHVGDGAFMLVLDDGVA